MIPISGEVRIWLALGATDMRKGMNGLARQVQERLARNPLGGDITRNILSASARRIQQQFALGFARGPAGHQIDDAAKCRCAIKRRCSAARQS
jgi:transposase